MVYWLEYFLVCLFGRLSVLGIHRILHKTNPEVIAVAPVFFISHLVPTLLLHPPLLLAASS